MSVEIFPSPEQRRDVSPAAPLRPDASTLARPDGFSDEGFDLAAMTLAPIGFAIAALAAIFVGLDLGLYGAALVGAAGLGGAMLGSSIAWLFVSERER